MYSMKPSYMRMEGDPPKDPWMAGETPGVPVSFRLIPEGQMYPKGWGIAWYECGSFRAVIMPIPFNIIGGLIWKFRNWLKAPGFIRRCAEYEARHIYTLKRERDMLQREVNALQARISYMGHRTDPYPVCNCWVCRRVRKEAQHPTQHC